MKNGKIVSQFEKWKKACDMIDKGAVVKNAFGVVKMDNSFPYYDYWKNATIDDFSRIRNIFYSLKSCNPIVSNSAVDMIKKKQDIMGLPQTNEKEIFCTSELFDINDEQLVSELRKRGWNVECNKTVERIVTQNISL